MRAYPISIDPDALTAFARGPEVARRRKELSDRLERAGRPKLIVRVDRLEPSKNVLRGFLAFEALLHKRRPELRKRVRFLAIQSISRENVPEYARYAAAVREVVARVNGMADPDQAPIWLLDGSDYALAIAALSLADVVLVNPVVDGMNLVAKEAAIVGRGAIVLSETAGAAEQLAGDALMVAAADVAGTSEMLERAWTMPPDERAGAPPAARVGPQGGPRLVADASAARPCRGFARPAAAVTRAARHDPPVRARPARLRSTSAWSDSPLATAPNGRSSRTRRPGKRSRMPSGSSWSTAARRSADACARSGAVRKWNATAGGLRSTISHGSAMSRGTSSDSRSAAWTASCAASSTRV